MTEDGSTTDVLRMIKSDIVDNFYCEHIYKWVHHKSTQICTTSTKSFFSGSSFGDSGSPLMEIDMENKEYKAIGIVSYGSLNNVLGPVVYTKVSSYVPWIKETLSSWNSSLPERQSISDDDWKWKKEKFTQPL